MNDYKGECGTCSNLAISNKKKGGSCKLPEKAWLGFVGLSKIKCKRYDYYQNPEFFCKCGVYKEKDWKYCANCGTLLKDGAE